MNPEKTLFILFYDVDYKTGQLDLQAKDTRANTCLPRAATVALVGQWAVYRYDGSRFQMKIENVSKWVKLRVHVLVSLL
jgi:hypothetical protein